MSGKFGNIERGFLHRIFPTTLALYGRLCCGYKNAPPFQVSVVGVGCMMLSHPAC